MKHEHEHGACALCRIELSSVGVTAGSDTLLSDISFHIHCGQLTALVGPNGAGKTTLIKALLGEVPHTGLIRHVDAQGHDFPTPRIGYVPQQLPFDREMPLTVCDLMAASLSRRPVWTGVSKKNREEILAALKETSADQLMKKRLGALSGGELQRVLLAMALKPLPDLLVLDEPVSGVDPAGLELFYATLDSIRRSFDLTIIIVSHDLDLVARFSDRLVLLDSSIRAVGPTKEVVASEEYAKFLGGKL